MQNKILLYGNGGHATVLKDLINKLGGSLAGIFDERNVNYSLTKLDGSFIIAIGNNETRERISQYIKHTFTTLIHPNAIIGDNVKIGEGTVILANAIIQPNVVIGKHCIINAGVIIDHDVTIEDFTSIYPGAYIGSGAIITRLKTVHPNEVVERKTIY